MIRFQVSKLKTITLKEAYCEVVHRYKETESTKSPVKEWYEKNYSM